MSQTPEELRAEFIRRREAGEAMPQPAITPQSHCGDGSYHHNKKSPKPAIAIDRNATPDAQLAQIVRALPDLIPGWGWRHEPADPGSWKDWGRLTRDDGAGLWFGLSAGRIEVVGDWPRSTMGSRQSFNPSSYQETEYTRITVALKRSADAIANDIERRFLPGYLAEYEKKIKARDEHDRKARAQTEITKRLAAIVSAEVRSGGNRYRPDEIADTFYGSTNSALRKCVVHYDGEADLEIRCDENTAAAILRLLKRIARARSDNDGNSG